MGRVKRDVGQEMIDGLTEIRDSLKQREGERMGTASVSSNSFRQYSLVYWPRKVGHECIVAATFNHAGLVAEKEDGITTCPPGNLEALGSLVEKALADCKYQPKFDYSAKKLSDWPAYIASGCKSISRFEDEFVRYMIRGVNEVNSGWEIVSPELRNDVVLVRSLLPRFEMPAEVGRQLREFHEFHLKVETLL